jgi:hypothetical protein
MRTLLLALLATTAACSDLPHGLERPPPPAPTFAVGASAETETFHDGLWEDGNAEIARFDARQMRYGELRDGELILITVKEPFDPERLVKADGPHHEHTIDALKLNTLLTFQTGVYTYRQMASAFVTRDALAPMKLATSSQEWCGTTSAFFTIRGQRGLLRSFSYFGAEAERSSSLALPADVVLEDALPVWLRALDWDVERRAIHLVPSQLSNRAMTADPVGAEVEVGAVEAIEVPEGRFEARAVTVSFGERRDVYHLEVTPPHALVRFTRGESVYERTFLSRAPYWEMNGTEYDDALVPEPPPPPTPAAETAVTPETPGPE